MTDYPKIEHALLAVAYANNGVNRDRPEEHVKAAIAEWLPKQKPDFDLLAIDTWLSTLDKDELETVVDGDEEEANELLADAPEGADDLLNLYFEQFADL